MITLRQGHPEDVETIVDFQVRMARETEELDLDRDTVTRGVGSVISDPLKGTYWVAEDDGEVVGVLLTMPEWSDWRNGTVLWIHSVYMVPEARGKGVYRKLYGHLKEKVESRPDLMGLRLYVDRRNRKAYKVYEALGMRVDHYDLFEWMKA